MSKLRLLIKRPGKANTCIPVTVNSTESIGNCISSLVDHLGFPQRDGLGKVLVSSLRPLAGSQHLPECPAPLAGASPASLQGAGHFAAGKTLRIVIVLLTTSLLLSVILEFGPLWQLALGAPVGLYGQANAAVLSAGGVGSWLAARLRLSKPTTIVGVAGLLVPLSLALVVVKSVVEVILAQGVLVAGGVGIGMVFPRLLHDSHPSGVRAGVASGVGPSPRWPFCSSRCSMER